MKELITTQYETVLKQYTVYDTILWSCPVSYNIEKFKSEVINKTIKYNLN